MLENKGRRNKIDSGAPHEEPQLALAVQVAHSLQDWYFEPSL
jgi:hypothetical protein